MDRLSEKNKIICIILLLLANDKKVFKFFHRKFGVITIRMYVK